MQGWKVGMDATVICPLEWPPAVPRTEYRDTATFSYQSTNGHRRLTFQKGRDRLLHELRMLGADVIVVATGMRVYQDGSGVPFADAREPADAGAVVMFGLDGERKSIAIDRYDRVADNLAAIAATIEALRGIERWGGGRIMQAAFSGFKQISATSGGQSWWEILGCDLQADYDTAKRAYRVRATEVHPDKPGGSDEAFRQLQWAWEQARQQLEPQL